MKIVKEFKWGMAHRLRNHNGPCFNIHGHTYHMKVVVKGELNKLGMVMDFADLKKVVQEKVISVFDHALLISDEDIILRRHMQNLSKDLKNDVGRNLKIVIVKGECTAENLVKIIFDKLKAHLNIVKIELWETPTSSAIYE